MPYAEFHCALLLYSSVQLEKIWGEAETKGVGSRWSIGYYIRYVLDESHPMASTRAGLFICPGQYRQEAGRLSLPFYSIEFFGIMYYLYTHDILLLSLSMLEKQNNQVFKQDNNLLKQDNYLLKLDIYILSGVFTCRGRKITY